MLLSSLLLEKISQKPSYFANVSSLDTPKSAAVLRHCVAPVNLLGADAKPLPYNLRDYHGMGKGVVPEVEFPIGVDITMGGFSKDLKDFVLWPGRIQPGAHDTETRSFENPPPGMEKMRRFCSNRAEIQVKDANRFLQNIAGIHHVMVAGNYTEAISEALIRMNVKLVAPPDFDAPQA